MLLSITKKRFVPLIRVRSCQFSATEVLKELQETITFDSQNRITNIPEVTPQLDASLDHAPKRTHTLTPKQVDLAIRNHLLYFSKDLHAKLDPIFRKELETYGHIYMFNYLPKVHLQAIPFDMIPG
jgi:hypothetical protein